jgi:hypothetical protein
MAFKTARSLNHKKQSFKRDFRRLILYWIISKIKAIEITSTNKVKTTFILKIIKIFFFKLIKLRNF